MAIYACSHFNTEELERMQALKNEAGGRPFLVVSLASEEAAVEKALESGVRGIVVGEDEFDTVTNALQVLNMGGFWIPDGQKIKASGKTTGSKTESQNSEILNKLTRRETQVLSMLAKGMKNHDIADSLELSYRTVVTHVYNIYRKLNLSSRTEAIHLAIASGLVDVNS
jgi:LuxR family transcriptional regulator of csgAB operon